MAEDELEELKSVTERSRLVSRGDLADANRNDANPAEFPTTPNNK
jgi:hypothetical protein